MSRRFPVWTPHCLLLFVLFSGVGLLRYRDMASVFDLAFWMGPSANAMVHGTPCVEMTSIQLQLVDASQTSLRLCTHRRPLVPAVIATFSTVSQMTPTPMRWRAVTSAVGAFVVAHLTIGTMAYASTGRFRVDSSIDWWNAAKGNHPAIADYYSWAGLDEMPIRIGASVHFADEWAFSDFFRRKFLTSVRAEPSAFLSRAARHMFEFVGRIDVGSSNLRETSNNPLAAIVTVPAALIIRLLVLVSLALGLRSWLLWARRLGRAPLPIEAGWALVLVAGALPFILGFAYLRHVTPLVVPAAFVCVRVGSAKLARFVQ